MNSSFYHFLVESNKLSRFCFINGLDLNQSKFVSNILKARYNKVSRIKKHFIYLLSRRKYCYFLTFTFDDYYVSCCDRTKKDLIKNCLNNIDDSLYILNVDYGDKNEREHFHCILGTDMLLDSFYFSLTYPCFSYCERVFISSTSLDKVSKYINKLSNHAVKDSTRYSRIFYNFKGYDKITDKDNRKFNYLNDKVRIYK